jgi:SAM-dependent methyltransferase
MPPDMISKFTDYLQSLDVSEKVFATDPMNNGPPFYMQTGKSALRVILTALLARVGYIGGHNSVCSILDLGSGYGRVTRWMRAAFPDAKITVADLDRNAVDFCAETFNATATSSPFEPDSYDLVFLGSVFTHLPPAETVKMFYKSIGSLRANGVLVFTTQGRYAALRAEAEPDARITRTIDRDALMLALGAFRADGFGFVANKNTPDYGSAWTSPQWFFERFGADPDVVQILFQEKGWDNFQDAYGYLRAPIAERARSRT